MDNVNHARLLVPAAEFALLLSKLIEPGTCLASLKRAHPDHDVSCSSLFSKGGSLLE